MTRVHIVSLVGDPFDYKEATHDWPGGPPPPDSNPGTRYTVEALSRFLNPDGISLVGTKQLADDAAAVLSHLKPEVTPIPEGQAFEEQQRVVGVIRDVLDDLRGKGAAIVYLDVTHGYRAQSLLAVSAAAFVRAEWRRLGYGTPEAPVPAIRVLYGNFDKHARKTTFWDLTDLLTLADWSAALDAATRFGRADDLAALVKADEPASATSDKQASVRTAFATELADRVTDFANDLCYNRWQTLLVGDARAPGSAARLAETLDASGPGYEAFTNRRPLLKGALDALRAAAEPLRASDLYDPEAVKASVALAKAYLRMQRFLECAATLREFGFTQLARSLGLTHPNGGVDPRPFRDALGLAFAADPSAAPTTSPDRARVGAAIAAKQTDGAYPLRLIEHLRKVAEVRNDLLHGGMKKKPIERASVVGWLGKFIEVHEELAVPPRSTP